MEKVCFAIVGVGGMGKGHVKYMTKSDFAQVVSICDINFPVAQAVAKECGAKAYPDHESCFDAGGIDAILIATPHYFHPPIAIAAMQRGLHVLTEKPVAVSVTHADRMAQAAAKAGVKYGVMFQWRALPAIRKAKQLIQAGELGEIWRTLLVETGWFRTQFYYDSGTWRGTWAGEGGGVLLNQAPHSLDMFTWLTGLPAKVDGRVATLHHKIEVEDSASAVLTYANSGTGYLTTNTWEFPGENMLRIVGSKGVMVIDNHQSIRIARCTPDAFDFLHNAKEMWGTPKADWKDVEVEPVSTWHEHADITENFCLSIRDGRPLIAPGSEGGVSLELANAIMLSSYTGKEVSLPLDRAAFDKLLAKLVRTSKFVK